uniref:COX6C domain-containing protein n=1 Tax=Strongyloides papillosus TaxID=174720 RepID=A0A0N5BSV0_STREA
MILWEWRRIYRQKIRSLFSTPKITYQEFARRKLFLGFGLFVVGWTFSGMFLEEKIMFRWDEMIGYKRLFDLKEVKELVKKENEENVAKRCDKEEKGESTLPPAFELDSH